MTTKCIVLATPHRRYDALEQALRSRGLRVERVRSPEELNEERLRGLAPDFVFFPHWSWKIPASVYESFECVIFHMTDVPYGRGGSPLQNLIVLGHEETKLSALRCVSELDAGPVYLKRRLELTGSAEEILERAARLMQDMIATIVEDRPSPQPQTGEPVLFRRRTPEQSDLRAAESLRQVYDMIRMLDAEGYPPAFLQIGPLRIEFAAASRSTSHVLATARITVTDPQKG